VRVSVGWASEELAKVLARLTSQQARGVVRIVEAELEGRSLSSLLDTPGQICTSTTYYGSGKRRGWKDNEHFQRSLELARRDYRQWLLEHSTGEALAILASTAPEAVGAIAGFRDGERRLAATSVLDRAAVETAAKQALLVSENDVDAAIERELARLAGDGQDGASGAAAGQADSDAL